MKWTHQELIGNTRTDLPFDEEVFVDPEFFRNQSRINSVKDVRASGRAFYDAENDRLFVTLSVAGTMLVPDAVNGEEIEYPFETESEEIYAFLPTDEDGVRIVTDGTVDLLEAVVDDIILEVPMQYSTAAPEDYPSGEGWRVISEADYEKSQEDRIDPRLAKLKEYKED